MYTEQLSLESLLTAPITSYYLVILSYLMPLCWLPQGGPRQPAAGAGAAPGQRPADPGERAGLCGPARPADLVPAGVQRGRGQPGQRGYPPQAERGRGGRQSRRHPALRANDLPGQVTTQLCLAFNKKQFEKVQLVPCPAACPSLPLSTTSLAAKVAVSQPVASSPLSALLGLLDSLPVRSLRMLIRAEQLFCLLRPFCTQSLSNGLLSLLKLIKTASPACWIMVGSQLCCYYTWRDQGPNLLLLCLKGPRSTYLHSWINNNTCYHHHNQ